VSYTELSPLLGRIADALERIAPPARPPTPWDQGWAFQWTPDGLTPAANPFAQPLSLLVGANAQKAALLANTERFALGLPANSALLWGVRGTGKSALVKAVCRAVAQRTPALKLVQADVAALTAASVNWATLTNQAQRVIVFLDDLSLDADGSALRALKPLLDGGLAGPSEGMIVYATSNRRHLVSRDPAENSAGDLFWSDTAQDRLALSDRFGLSLGFHPWDQATYLAAVDGYARAYGLSLPGLHSAALAWAMGRGARSGRTAWQFILDRAGAEGVRIGSA
jgi:uncharacterized protein